MDFGFFDTYDLTFAQSAKRSDHYYFVNTGPER